MVYIDTVLSALSQNNKELKALPAYRHKLDLVPQNNKELKDTAVSH